MNFTILERFASRHHGLVTFDHACSSGWSKSAWYRAFDTGGLIEMAPKVARLPGRPLTAQNRILAPILSLGDGVVASHRSAALLWGFDVGSQAIDLTVIGRSTRLSIADVVLHHPRDLVDLKASMRQHIPSTNPLRVLVDLGAVAPEHVADAVAHFAIEGLVAPAAAWAVVERHSIHGRHGVVALRNALEDWRLGEKPPDSVLEVHMRALIDRFNLPDVDFHPCVEGFEVDFRIAGTRLLIECDGWKWHGASRDRVEHDYERDALLGRRGWVVRRFSWQQIRRRPAWVAATIRDHLAWLSEEAQPFVA
jgi:very-short-patch-repair endonuclease